MDLSGLKTIQDYSDRMLRQMDEHGKIYWVPLCQVLDFTVIRSC